MKKLITTILLIYSFVVVAQESSIRLATDVLVEEWQSVLHAPEGRVDRQVKVCLLYTSPSPRDGLLSRMPSSA